MKRRLRAILLAAAFTVAAVAPVAALDQVRTNSITAYTGFYIYVADTMGFFKKNGIDASPRWFPSGAPIMQGAAGAQWDMAFLGAPPMVVGGPALGLVTVGMIAEEGGMHELIGRPAYVDAAKADPNKLRGARIFVTTLSTGHYMTEACLRHLGLSANDVRIVPSEQQATLSAFVAGEGDLAQVWSPQTTVLKARGNKVICSAKELALSMPGISVAHPKFIADNGSDKITRWLRATAEAVEWIREDRKRTFELYKKYDAFRGFNFKDDMLEGEVDLVMNTYMNVDQQLAMLKPSAGKPEPAIAASFSEIAEFFIRQGRLKTVPDYRPYIDSRYLEAIKANP